MEFTISNNAETCFLMAICPSAASLGSHASAIAYFGKEGFA